jgi:hypothetical protein
MQLIWIVFSKLMSESITTYFNFGVYMSQKPVDKFINMRQNGEEVLEININRKMGKSAVVTTLSDLRDECGYYEVLKETINEKGKVKVNYHAKFLMNNEIDAESALAMAKTEFEHSIIS